MARMTEGRRLRRRLDAALAAEATRTGAALQWDERELEFLRLAEAAEDRRHHLLTLLDTAQTDAAGPGVQVKLSAEIRALDRQIVDLLGRIQVGVGAAKSGRHQRAATARWDRLRAARG